MLGAIHTTIMTATNTFLDILSSPPEFEYFDKLREEAAAVFKTEQDWLDSSSLGKLTCTDSSIRESLRKNPVLTRVVLREVVPKEGLDTPDGHHLPQGTWVGAPAVSLHHDERFYPKPHVYDPFRFAEKAPTKATANDSSLPDGKDSESGTTSATASKYGQQRLSTTSDTYLAFGYGRHSWCVIFSFLSLTCSCAHLLVATTWTAFENEIHPLVIRTICIELSYLCEFTNIRDFIAQDAGLSLTS